jgi:hypothetical protein
MPSPAIMRCKLSLVFTGHMIDAPGRAVPRFPPSLELRAAEAIHSHICAARDGMNGSVEGFASGARGGDILFHEICRAEGIPTSVVLPFAPEAFIDRSVRGVRRGAWIRRFRRLWDETSANRRVILDLAREADPFGKCNAVMLERAKARGESVELLAFWDGEGADKPGGTAAFVEAVRAAGGHVTQIDSRALLAAAAIPMRCGAK